jgi:lysophospholipase L1-like esterase
VKRYLALGDSYTVGEGLKLEESWPSQLVRRLRARNVQVSDPLIVAKTGWTTDELMIGIDHAAPVGSFDLVSLLIGVNNQYRGRSIEEYRQQFRALLARAIALGDEKPGRVIVVSIPDWGVTPFANGRDPITIGHAIEAFNAANHEETSRHGARYVDITSASRRAGARSQVVEDGLHPSAEMYSAWADLVLAEALSALTDPM